MTLKGLFQCEHTTAVRGDVAVQLLRLQNSGWFICYFKFYIGGYRFYIGFHMFYVCFYRCYIGLYRFYIGLYRLYIGVCKFYIGLYRFYIGFYSSVSFSIENRYQSVLILLEPFTHLLKEIINHPDCRRGGCITASGGPAPPIVPTRERSDCFISPCKGTI